MNYAELRRCDVANGPGVRVSLFVSGCHHHCQGCFNEVAWNPKYGQPYTNKTKANILKYMDNSFISGLSILGGEPLESYNISSVSELILEVGDRFPDKDIWLYTGYRYEELISNVYLYYDILHNIDVLVDGKFIESLKDLNLKFRGSSNQRIIDMKKTIECGQIELLNI
jgi:anaerobic ribonucleoside-triphosphate reductase activating protein